MYLCFSIDIVAGNYILSKCNLGCPAPATTTGYTNPSYTNLTYESTATMSCDTGYTGTASDIICQADKQWSTPVGCTIIGK